MPSPGFFELRSATEAQRRVIVILLNRAIGSLYCQKNYRVYEAKDITIRESSTNPPPKGCEVRLRFILASLGVVINNARILERDFLGITTVVSAMNVQMVSIHLLKRLIALLAPVPTATKKPDGIDEAIWARIPNEVSRRWDRFSTALQRHFVECIEADMANLIAKISEGGVGATSVSSVRLSPPCIPVRLALPVSAVEIHDPRYRAYKLYDIIELLSISPEADGSRKHPITRAPFWLGDILPAGDALRVLQKQALKALEGEEDAPAAGATAGAARRVHFIG